MIIWDVAYCNMTTKNINGKDTPIPIDWSQVVPAPQAAITKVSELVGVDESFVPNWHSMGALNIARAGYHFYHNGQLWYNSARQAAAFSNAILAQGLKPNDYFILDNEEKDSKGNPLVSLSESLDWFYNVKINLGLSDYSRFWLYSTADILNGLNTGKLSAGQLAILKQIKTWIAGYPDNPPSDVFLNPADVPARYIPDPNIYGKMIGWQFSESGTVQGIPGSVDLNLIDQTFFESWVGNVQPPSPPVPVPPTPQPTPQPTTTTLNVIYYFTNGALTGMVSYNSDNTTTTWIKQL